MISDHQHPEPTRNQTISQNHTINIWDQCGTIPEGEFGYNWSGYKDTGGGLSLLRLLEEYSDELRGRFFHLRADFLSRLAQTFHSFSSQTNIENQLLWMSLLVESGTIKSPDLLNTFRLLAFDLKLKSTNAKKIRYIGPQMTIAGALRKLSQRHNLDFYWEKTPSQHVDSLLRRMWSRLPNPLRSLIWLFKYVFQHWSLKAYSTPNWFEGPNAVFVFSYFAHLDKESCESGKFYSRQWEVLPELLRSIGTSINWAHLFLFSVTVPDIRTGIRWLKSFNRDSSGQEFHVFLDTFLDLKLISKCLLDWTRIQFFYLKMGRKIECQLESRQYGWIWPVFKKDWRDSMTGATAMNNILYIHLFDRLLSEVPHQERGFYLCENQGWERAFLQAWRIHGHGRIIGVAHSTIRYWDLRYYDATMASIISDLPRPDALAVNGPKNWLNLQKAGHPMERCIRVEALRYFYLKVLLNNVEKKAIQQDRNRRLLLLGDIQSGTTDRMLRALEHANAKLKVPYEVWVKPHPHNQIELGKYPNLKVIPKDLSLKELFPMIDVTLVSVLTSAEIDAYCSGRPIINYLDPYDLNFSNLRGIDGMKFVSTSEELDEALEQIEFDGYVKGKPEDFFWLDPELPKWNALLG